MTRIVIQTGSSAPITLDIEDTGDTAPIHVHLPSALTTSPITPSENRLPKKQRLRALPWRHPIAIAAVSVVAVLGLLRITTPSPQEEPVSAPFARLPPIPGNGPQLPLRQSDAQTREDEKQAILDTLKLPARVEPPPGVTSPTKNAASSAVNAFGLEN